MSNNKRVLNESGHLPDHHELPNLHLEANQRDHEHEPVEPHAKILFGQDGVDL